MGKKLILIQECPNGAHLQFVEKIRWFEMDNCNLKLLDHNYYVIRLQVVHPNPINDLPHPQHPSPS